MLSCREPLGAARGVPTFSRSKGALGVARQCTRRKAFLCLVRY